MLETTWFVLWVLLWGIYFMLDGFDLGLGSVFPFIAKNEQQKKTIYDSVGPFWDGNEVWLITAGGVTFAAFPGTYAVLFSAFYSPLMLVLFALILRGAALGLRFETEGLGGRKLWDWTFFVGSLASSILFGVAFANIFMGVPIDGEGALQGSLFTFLNPYGLAGGVLFLAFFVMHGFIWLAIKADGDLMERAASLARVSWVAVLVLAVVFDVMTAFYTSIWDSYFSAPIMLIVPAVNVLALVATGFFILTRSWSRAWWSSALFILSAAFFGMLGIYPALLPSTLDPAYSVTMSGSASSPLTLKIMLGVALVFVPIVIAYQAWVYWVFRGKAGGDASYEQEGH